MTLEDFKDVYKDAPLLTKLNLLMEVQSRRADAQAIAATERWNENAEAERHWVNEHRSASAKAMWLFEELKKALEAQEPCEDAVSRKDVISVIKSPCDMRYINGNWQPCIGDYIESINNLPAVAPKAHEPRVMTLEEVKEKIGSGECVFTECEKEGQWMRYGNARLSVDQGDSCRIAFLISRRGDNPYVRWWMIYYENYNKTWRCWSRKPTDEQREATPWN